MAILFYLLAETGVTTVLWLAICLVLNVKETNKKVTSSPAAIPHNKYPDRLFMRNILMSFNRVSNNMQTTVVIINMTLYENKTGQGLISMI